MFRAMSEVYYPKIWTYFPFFIVFTARTTMVMTTTSPANCPKFCHRIKASVCDNKGNTHQNSCEFAIKKCEDPTLEIKYDGDCESKTSI